MEGYLKMDEKNDVSNNTNSQNNMSYSFDFSSQVDNTATPVNQGGVTVSASDTPAVNQAANVQDSVSPAPNVAQEAMTSVQTPVNPSVQQSSVNSTVQQATVNSSVQQAPVSPGVQPNTVNSVEGQAPINQPSQTTTATNTVASEVTDAPMPGVVPPVTPETVMAQKNENEEIELIKDKKATKNFLIGLFVVLIIFIIALPFIFNIMG